MRGKLRPAVLATRLRVGQRLPGCRGALGGRAVHQHRRTAGRGKADQSLQQAQRAQAQGLVGRGDGQARRCHQQPVQAGQRHAVGLRGAAQLGGQCVVQSERIIGQRERRQLQPLAADGRGQLALALEGLVPQHLVAQRQAQGGGHQAAFRARRSDHSFQPTVPMISAAKTAEMGRVKKGVRSPSDSSSARRRFFSSRSPSTMPRTSGAIG